jgi:hypothetical protein
MFCRRERGTVADAGGGAGGSGGVDAVLRTAADHARSAPHDDDGAGGADDGPVRGVRARPCRLRPLNFALHARAMEVGVWRALAWMASIIVSSSTVVTPVPLGPGCVGLCSSHPRPETPPELGTNCTTPSLIPTSTGNTVRSFCYARTTVRSQGSSTTALAALTSSN